MRVGEEEGLGCWSGGTDIGTRLGQEACEASNDMAFCAQCARALTREDTSAYHLLVLQAKAVCSNGDTS